MMYKKLINFSYLSLILLSIILLYTFKELFVLTLITMFITSFFILYVIRKEKVFCIERFYDFALITIVFLFAIYNIFNRPSSQLYVTIILALTLGVFLNNSFFKINKEQKKLKKIILEKPINPYEEKMQITKDKPKKNISKKEITKKKKKEKSSKKKEIIVSTKNGLTYHKPSCNYMKKTAKKNVKMYISKGQADAMGLTPCKICIK